VSKVFNDVSVFVTACGHTCSTEPVPKNALSDLYFKLIVEEYDEFVDAYVNNDDAEQLDACFDMMWVIIGYMKSRGWDCEKSWEEGAKSNLNKIDRLTGECIRREDGKILKPLDWTPPNFKKFV